jgi:hypothetical protein
METSSSSMAMNNFQRKSTNCNNIPMPQTFRGVSRFVFFSTHLNDKVEEDYEGEASGTHGDDEKYSRFGRKPEGKRSLESSKRIRNDNIKMDFKTPEFGYLD